MKRWHGISEKSRRFLLKMALGTNYAEVSLKNELKSSGIHSNSPAAFFQKNSQLLEDKNYKRFIKEMIHTNLKCVRINSTMEGKVWSCCPQNWKSFSSSCYFFSTDAKSWKERQENCSRMEAHLVVINSKEEQILASR
ncbi:C-type lectin domain family 4 member A-like [Marmota marmota marmota]|uniref:C-type lectin domain family 4 member A-like n=1 Tax=Marmota marmota marmota TaxID=9994 RepID=UPI0020938312|nr:C-type lectin domain family 4 member A-like [Marmota marmota marmota]